MCLPSLSRHGVTALAQRLEEIEHNLAVGRIAYAGESHLGAGRYGGGAGDRQGGDERDETPEVEGDRSEARGELRGAVAGKGAAVVVAL